MGKKVGEVMGFLFLFLWQFLCSIEACPGTSSVDHAGLNTHRDPPLSASQMLGLKVCTTTTWLEVADF